MDKRIKLMENIKSLEMQIAELPKGYITYKTVSGKRYPYHQWSENGKKTALYLKENEVAPLAKKIARRKGLEAQLREMKKLVPRTEKTRTKNLIFETNVNIGIGLSEMAVFGWEKRDCYEKLKEFLYSSERDRVCLVYGLRRTGKTTLLRQAIADMSDEDLKKAAYIKGRKTDTMAMMNRDLKKLYEEGFRYIFIDEVTLLADFIDSAALFSDVFAAMGMKIVLSGTDSLGFWFAMDDELYDRAKLIHTTFIPYREYSRVLGINSIDEYIRYGGTLRAGETAFDDTELMSDDASFRDDESTRRYIDTAICRNIQNSLAYYQGGGHFRHLYDLYEAGELTGAINRIIEDMNHRFVLEILTKDFVSSDLGMSAKNLRNEKNTYKRTDILDNIDTKEITERLMSILEIINIDEQSIRIRNEHITEIKEYLKALDLIEDCPLEMGMPGLKSLEHIIFTQPGMRYCQAQALVFSLLRDEIFLMQSEKTKQLVCERILEEVRGRMLEDIVLLETSKALSNRYKVFKLQFDRGEFDMVIYDKKEDNCRIYEIKHNRTIVSEQAKHLLDEEKSMLAEKRFGRIDGKYVLYLGKNAETENGVHYRNAEEFLKSLPVLV